MQLSDTYVTIIISTQELTTDNILTDGVVVAADEPATGRHASAGQDL